MRCYSGLCDSNEACDTNFPKIYTPQVLAIFGDYYGLGWRNAQKNVRCTRGKVPLFHSYF